MAVGISASLNVWAVWAVRRGGSFAIQCVKRIFFFVFSRWFLILLAILASLVLWVFPLESPLSDVFLNPYDELGVSRQANASEVQRSYRRLALQWHPDRNREPSALSRFQKISRAKEILLNPTLKANYDEFGHPDGLRGIVVTFPALLLWRSTTLVLVYLLFVVFVVSLPILLLFAGGFHVSFTSSLPYFIRRDFSRYITDGVIASRDTNWSSAVASLSSAQETLLFLVDTVPEFVLPASAALLTVSFLLTTALLHAGKHSEAAKSLMTITSTVTKHPDIILFEDWRKICRHHSAALSEMFHKENRGIEGLTAAEKAALQSIQHTIRTLIRQ